MTELDARARSAPTVLDRLLRIPKAYRFDELAAASSPRHVRTMTARGQVVRVAPDVYVPGIHADSFLARADAALLWAGPRAALSGLAAMFVWQLLDHPPDTIDVVLPVDAHVFPPAWIRVRRTAYPPATLRISGMRVAGPADAMVRGYGLVRAADRAEVLYKALRGRQVTVRGLQAAVDRTPRCPARRELRERLALAALGAESYLEEVSVTTVFRGKEFARFARQHRIRAFGERYRLDMYDPETMTAVELDGKGAHSDPRQRARDLHRDAQLARLGIQTVRLTYEDLTERPEWCRDVVRAVLRSRAPRSAGSAGS